MLVTVFVFSSVKSMFISFVHFSLAVAAFLLIDLQEIFGVYSGYYCWLVLDNANKYHLSF